MAIRKLFKSAVKKVDPTPWLSEKDRKRFYTAEDYYNAKYPKLNITFPRYELDVKSFKDNPSTAFSIYHSDVRSILNTKNFRLPIFKGEADDEIALKVLRWAMNPELAGLAPATASLEEKMKAGALVYLCDEHTTAWNQHNIDEIEDRLWKAIWDGDVVEVVSLLSRRNEIINEYWSYSYQTFIRGYGDCEDGAILMYDVLRKSGIPAWKLRINAGYVNNPDGSLKYYPNGGRDGGHAWLTYYVESQFWKGKDKREDKWVVLDWCNGHKYAGDVKTPLDEREPWSADIYDTNLIFSFNEEYCWSKSNGQLAMGGLFHVEGCPVLRGKIELPPELKARAEVLGLQEQKVKDDYARNNLCTCRIECKKCGKVNCTCKS
jgi:hypothetical protein